MGQERKRRHPRVAPLVIRVSFEMDGRLCDAYATSLSEGGAFLALEDSVGVGTTLALQFDLPWNLGEVAAEGRVVYELSADDKPSENSTKGVGIEFVFIGREDQEKIREFVEKFRQVAAQLEETAST